jgi:hypothetical protein
MNFRSIKHLTLLFVALFICIQASAQRRIANSKAIMNNERLSIYAGIGLSSYYGDLCDGYGCMQFRPNLGIGSMLRLTDNFGIKGELNYFRLYSKDSWEGRNLDFRSNNVELYVAGYLQLNPYVKYARNRKSWNIYAFAGFGLLYFRPEGSLDGDWVPLRKHQTEGVKYEAITAMIPFGGAVSYRIKNNLTLMLELGYRKTFTDRLDDVSSKEWRMLDTFEDPTAAAVSNKTGRGDDFWLKSSGYRGNPESKDGYFISQVKLIYTYSSKTSNYKLRRAPLRKRF